MEIKAMKEQDSMFEFFNKVPEGWRFYTCDWSIPNRCGIVFTRNSEDKKKWHNLSEKEREIIDLYVSSVGIDFKTAFNDGINKCFPLETDYQI